MLNIENSFYAIRVYFDNKGVLKFIKDLDFMEFEKIP